MPSRCALWHLSMVAFCCATAAAAQEQQKLFIEGDIVRRQYAESVNTGPVCVLAKPVVSAGKSVSLSASGCRNASGQPLDDKGLKSLVVELSDGKKIPAEYRARPPVAVRARLGLTGPIDYFWSSAWLIPADYPHRFAHIPGGRNRHAGQHPWLGANERFEVAAGGDAGRGRIYEMNGLH